jgi:hypothetical protein
MSRFFKVLPLAICLTALLSGKSLAQPTQQQMAQPTQQQMKNKMDLDDLMIKGELQSDDRLLILSRQKNEMKNFVKFRTNYREEILQQLPKTQKKRNY